MAPRRTSWGEELPATPNMDVRDGNQLTQMIRLFVFRRYLHSFCFRLVAHRIGTK
jgi:hypothetical protein